VQVLVVGDRVLTPFGGGHVVRRSRRAPYQLHIESHGAECYHSYVYDVELAPSAADLVPDTAQGVWVHLFALQLFSMVSGGAQLPLAALGVFSAALSLHGGASVTCIVRELLLPPAASHPRRLRLCRRELLCLSVGPRCENHFHSSLRTREWAFGLAHPAVDPASYGAISWRHSQHASVEYFLFWQQIFEGVSAIHRRMPRCRLLLLTEACYSGGAIKFMSNESLRSDRPPPGRHHLSQTRTHTRMHTRTRTRTHARTHTCARTPAPARTHARTRARALAHTRRRTLAGLTGIFALCALGCRTWVVHTALQEVVQARAVAALPDGHRRGGAAVRFGLHGAIYREGACQS
jgi:hypothetical protein